MYLNIIAGLYCTCATSTTTESPIQKSHGKTPQLKQRVSIEESPIDYGSLRTCKNKSVSKQITRSLTSSYSSTPTYISALILKLWLFSFSCRWCFSKILADSSRLNSSSQKNCLPWQVCASCKTKTFGVTVKYCSDYSVKGLCGHGDEKMICSCSETPLSPALYPKQMIGAVDGYCETDEVWDLTFSFSQKFFFFLLFSLVS